MEKFRVLIFTFEETPLHLGPLKCNRIKIILFKKRDSLLFVLFCKLKEAYKLVNNCTKRLLEQHAPFVQCIRDS